MGKLAGSASSEIDAPVGDVWAVVQDIETWPQWQGTLGSVAVREHDGDGRVVLAEAEFDAKVQKIKTVLRFIREPGHELTWEQEDGTLESLRGSWLLEDLGGARTRATYTLEVTPGGFLGMLISGSVQERLKEQLVDVRPGELKTRVEG